jgi:hypothetical protein
MLSVILSRVLYHQAETHPTNVWSFLLQSLPSLQPLRSYDDALKFLQLHTLHDRSITSMQYLFINAHHHHHPSRDRPWQTCFGLV